MKSLLAEETINTLQKLCPNISFYTRSIESAGDLRVFFCLVSNENEMEIEWKSISSIIAASYQSAIESDFEKWNIYLLYITPSKISITLKYKIENDKFSCRKIVVDEFTEPIDENTISKLTATHITNTDLLESTLVELKNIPNYSSDSMVWKLINSQNKGKSSKKEREQNTEILLAELEKTLKNEI